MKQKEQSPLTIFVGYQNNGATYQFDPISREKIQETFPSSQQAKTIFVGFDTKDDFEKQHGPIWKQIILLLSGVSASELIEKFGTIYIKIPWTKEEFLVA